MCITNSKLIMAEFWYNTLSPMFGAENFRLIYTGMYDNDKSTESHKCTDILCYRH